VVFSAVDAVWKKDVVAPTVRVKYELLVLLPVCPEESADDFLEGKVKE
jgi:hypothetical protein